METDDLTGLSADEVHTVVEYENVRVKDELGDEGSQVIPSSLHISFQGQEDHAYVDTDSVTEDHNQITAEASDLNLSEDGTVGGLPMPIILVQQGLPTSGDQATMLEAGGCVVSTSQGTGIEGSVLATTGDDAPLSFIGNGETLQRYQRVVLVNSDGLTTANLIEAGGDSADSGMQEASPSKKRIKLESGSDNTELGDTAYILTMAQDASSCDENSQSSSATITKATTPVTMAQKAAKKRKTVSHKSLSQVSEVTKPGPGGINLTKEGVQGQEEDMDITQAWFTTRDDKVALQNKGHQWRQGQWSRDEVELLQLNIARYCQEREIGEPSDVIFNMSKDERKDFYRTVAKGLERPLFSVYRRVIRMYDQKNHLGKYTPEELQQLRDLRTKHGTDWATIGAAMGRSASSVKDRCRLMKETCNSGKWLPEEERRLTQAVYDLSGVPPGEGVTHGLSWAMVAERVATRSEKQCRTKWLNYLNWKQKGGVEWTREDDLLLIKKLSDSGFTDDTDVNWTELATQLRSARSPQWLRGKWWTIKRHVHNYQSLSLPAILDTLKAMGTMDVRMKPPGPEFKVNSLDLQNFTAQSGNITFTIPLSSLNPDGTINSSALEEEVIASGNSGNTLEVLQGLSPGSHQGAFFLTQPTSGAISLTGTSLGTDHIIVHMLPLNQAQLEAVGEEESACIQNVAVQMNPQVIISAGEGQDGDLVGPSVVGQSGMDSPTLQLVDQALISHSHADLQVLTQSDEINTAQCSEMGQSELDAQEELSNQGGIISVAEPGFVDGTQSLSDGDSELVVNISPSHTVVSAASAPTIFVTNSSHHPATSTSLIHNMSSLTDPMLPAEGSDLISTADIDADKGQGQDGEESEVDSPSS